MAKQKSKPFPKTNEPTFGGPRATFEALKNPRLKVRMVACTATVRERHDLANLFALAVERLVPIKIFEAKQLDQLLGSPQHQGVICRVAGLPSIGMQELLSAKEKPNLLALDQVQDPMNLGAILRSANACAVKAVICPKDRSAPLSDAAIKASAGAALHTPVLYVNNLGRALDELKEAGYWVVGLVAPDEEVQEPDTKMKVTMIHQLPPPKPWVLVAGSEGSGLRLATKRNADFWVTIPMLGEVESLNVSAACAVALCTLSRNL